jgi:homogentisate 1,2-dioxygenase
VLPPFRFPGEGRGPGETHEPLRMNPVPAFAGKTGWEDTHEIPNRMTDALTYQSGFGNHFSSEAVAGALPVGQNSPQTPPFGLYAEQLSGTAFTAPRHENRRSWLYRLRPSAGHGPYAPYAQDKLKSGPFDAAAPTPNRLRWDPLEVPTSRPTSSTAWSRSAATATWRPRPAWPRTCTWPTAR